MTGLLMAIAIIAMLSLLSSAASNGAKVTASDDGKRGDWGIAHWTPTRVRPLNPHERRWQTSLLAGKDKDTRWRDLVAEIQTLERLNDIEPDATTPKRFDARWLDTAILRLETEILQETPTNDHP